MKKVSRKNLIILAVALSVFSIFVIPRIIFHTGVGATRRAAPTYYCPMHPTYTAERPGDCPICNMKLVPRPDAPVKKEHKILYYRHPMGQPDTSPVPKKDSMGMDYLPVYEDELSGTASEVPGHAGIQLDRGRQQLIGVKLGKVEKRLMKKEIRTTGRVAFDAELYTAQREFISAVASLEKSKGGPYHELRERAEELVKAVRTRLRILGMSKEEIEELGEKAAVHDRNLILPSGQTGPFSSVDQFVWVYGNIYEYELPFVGAGSTVKAHVPTFPEREFVGEVRGLTPVLEAGTRSILLRAKVGNPEGLLQPEMYVDLYIESEIGEALAIPAEAVMETGERKIVFAAKGDGYFEPREVILGARAGDFYEVKSGLAADEQVVVSGNFLIDSESRLQAALQGMGGGSGHQHGA